MKRWLLPALLLAVSLAGARAEILEFPMKAGEDRDINLASAVDDESFRTPRGYAGHGPQSRIFTRQIEIKNDGDKALTGRLLVVNGNELSNAAGIRRTLGLSSDPGSQGRSMEKIFTFWKEHRSHAGSGQVLAGEPFAALHFWGYTLCGEDTLALARLAYLCDVPARYVQLNGHVAAEYRYAGDWHLFDGDQNACYLRLDNHTLASADDLRVDPFLALRTKIFGKHSPQEFSASAFNCGLLEHVNLTQANPVKVKIGPAPLNAFTLQPGETLIWHADTPPEKPIGKLDTEKPDALRHAALATIEHRVNAAEYERGDANVIQIPSVFPILRAINRTTGEVVEPKDGYPEFKATLIVQGDKDDIVVFSQCSRNALPLLRHGANRLQLDAKAGSALIAIHYDPAPAARPPSVKLAAGAAKFVGSPAFKLTTQPKAEKFWWQVSDNRDFSFVAPSLEGVAPWAPELRFDPVTDTFLSPGRTYYLHVKAQAGEVWGEWSETLEFRVEKPATPTSFQFAASTGGEVKLTWESPDKGVEYLIYGGNRRDFMPALFTEEEIVAMESTKVTERRANQNLVKAVKEKAVEFVPKARFYRVIARRGGALSVPGPLIRLPDEFAKDLPPAMILQVRTSKEGTKEIYRAKEEQLPDGPDPAKEEDVPPPEETSAANEKPPVKEAPKVTAKPAAAKPVAKPATAKPPKPKKTKTK